jgi:hypothetical protein
MSFTKSLSHKITTTDRKVFICPVEHCEQVIDENPRQIAEHVKKSHTTISKKLGFLTNSHKPVYICKPCNSYTTIIHHHCFECEHPENGGKPFYFRTAEERDYHLKHDHTKWWLEYECKFGFECRGKKGGCGFNHNHFIQPFITDITTIPSCICRYDRPWNGVRCYREKCSFSHFWGRVRYLLKIRSTTSSEEIDLTTTTGEDFCADCDSDTKVVEPELKVVEPELKVVEPELKVVEPELKVVEPEPSILKATIIHYQCFECEHPENGGKQLFFRTAEERNYHLKHNHTKWWLEYECKFGFECRGKKGGCGFNHNHFDQPFITTDITTIPSCICRYDRPWNGVRCYREKCSFSHFRGRVRYLLKIRSTTSSEEIDSSTTREDLCTECDSVSKVA